MCAARRSSTRVPDDPQKKVQNADNGASRRAFLGRLGGVAAASFAASNLGFESSAIADDRNRERASGGRSGGVERASQNFKLRVETAQAERDVPIPLHPANGDEQRYKERIGNYSKALPHNAIGEVDVTAYNALLRACESGDPSDWNAVPLGGNTRLTDPQAGLAFDMEGTDSHQLAIPPRPPSLEHSEPAKWWKTIGWRCSTTFRSPPMTKISWCNQPVPNCPS
jgi:hypothetical protein